MSRRNSFDFGFWVVGWTKQHLKKWLWPLGNWWAFFTIYCHFIDSANSEKNNNLKIIVSCSRCGTSCRESVSFQLKMLNSFLPLKCDRQCRNLKYKNVYMTQTEARNEWLTHTHTHTQIITINKSTMSVEKEMSVDK